MTRMGFEERTLAAAEESILQDASGQFVFWPEARSGAWTADELAVIVRHLVALNGYQEYADKQP